MTRTGALPAAQGGLRWSFFSDEQSLGQRSIFLPNNLALCPALPNESSRILSVARQMTYTQVYGGGRLPAHGSAPTVFFPTPPVTQS